MRENWHEDNRRQFLQRVALGGVATGLAVANGNALAAPASPTIVHVGGPDRPFQTVQAALATISGATQETPYLILVDPGVYAIEEAGIPIRLKPFVTVAGLDALTTRFVGRDNFNFVCVNNSAVRNLTVEYRSATLPTVSAALVSSTITSFLAEGLEIYVHGGGAAFRLGYTKIAEIRNSRIVTDGYGFKLSGGHVYIHDCNIHLVKGADRASRIGIATDNYSRIFVFSGKIGTGYGYPDITDSNENVIGLLALPGASGRIQLFNVWSICRNTTPTPGVTVTCVRNESALARIRLFGGYVQSEGASGNALTLHSPGGGKIEVYGTRYSNTGSGGITSANQIGLMRYTSADNGNVVGEFGGGPTSGGLILLDASDGPFRLFLPRQSTALPTEQFIFKKVDKTLNAVTIDARRLLIDGSSTATLGRQYQMLHLRYADGQYFIVG